jgi:tetratricopeptide (TPR) repeat protein
LENYLKALEIREKLLGKEHEENALAFNNSGTMYYQLGDYQNALKYHLVALEIKKKFCTNKNDEIAFVYNKVAMDYEALNDNGKALENYQKAFSIYSSLPGQETEADKVRQAIEKLNQK